MTGQTVVRECTLDDADMEFLARLRAAVFPYRVQSVASQRNVFQTVPQRARFRVLPAEAGGVRVGMPQDPVRRRADTRVGCRDQAVRDLRL